MRHTCRKKSQSLNALALDGFKGLLPRFGCIMENQRNARAATAFPIQRRGINVQKTFARKRNFKFLPHHSRPFLRVQLGATRPIKLRQEFRNEFALRFSGMQPKESRNRFVEINSPSIFIEHEDAIFDCVEKRFQKTAFARKTLHDSLKSLRIEPP